MNLQFICAICGNKNNIYPKTTKKFNTPPPGWFSINTPKELSNSENPNPVPYNIYPIPCLHKMEQLL